MGNAADLLGRTGDAEAVPEPQTAAFPGVQGGLWLQSAQPTAPAAYGASGADALPAIHERLPRCAASYVHRPETDQLRRREHAAPWWTKDGAIAPLGA